MFHGSPSHQAQITSKRDLTVLCEVEDFHTGSVLRTTFAFVDVHDNIWFGQVLGVRKYDLTIQDLRQNLCQISDEVVYPVLTPGLTIVAEGSDVKSYYIKRPKLLCLDNLEETQLLPRMLLEEAHVLELLKPYGHRNIVQYHGCISKRGRIIGLALEKYEITLQYRFEDDPRELDVTACIRGIRAGMEHLHSLGLAHNDLNPTNIALDKDDQPVILDFGSCRKFGETLLSGGTPGWIDEDYSTSASHQDESALQKLESWLREKQSDRTKEARKHSAKNFN